MFIRNRLAQCKSQPLLKELEKYRWINNAELIFYVLLREFHFWQSFHKKMVIQKTLVSH